MKKIFYILLFLFLVASTSWSATRRMYENFDDQSFADNNIDIWYENGTEAYVTGRTGSGYALKLSDYILNGDTQLAWLGFPKPWPTDYLYMSGYIRLYQTGPACTAGSGGWKWFYPRWYGAVRDNYVSVNLQYVKIVGDFGISPEMYLGNYPSGASYYDIINGNAGWVRYEYLIHFPSGNVKVWYNGRLVGDKTRDYWINERPRFVNLTFPGIKTHGNDYPCTFYRVIDDWEFWDGCPNTSGYSCSGGTSVDEYPPSITFNQPTSGQTGVSTTGDIKFYVIDSDGNLDPLLDNHSLFYFTIQEQP